MRTHLHQKNRRQSVDGTGSGVTRFFLRISSSNISRAFCWRNSGEAVRSRFRKACSSGLLSSEKSSLYSRNRALQWPQAAAWAASSAARGPAERPAARLRRSSSLGQFELDALFTLGSGSNANWVRWNSSTRLRQEEQSSRCVSTQASVSDPAPEARFPYC